MTSRNTSRKRDAADGRAKCPICGSLRADDYRPFCSRRCADVDLGRWLSERYAMPLPDHEAGADPDEPDR
ncbi:MAG: DNA gyrase inhibitor YacG [Dichotomicrobium sp.]